MFLGIDVGTSAVKAALSDDDGTPVYSCESPLAVQRDGPGCSEQHPEAWWQGAVAACAALRDSQRAAWARVAAIGLSGQMHGPVLLDAGHRVLRPAILWNDSRAHAEARELARLPGIERVAGVRPLPGMTAATLVWLRRHEPGVLDRLAHLLLPKDYLGLRLCGQLSTDMSDAAGTLLFDQAARAWSDVLIRAAGVDAAWLPALHEGTEIIGTLREDAARALNLRAGIAVVAGGGDTAAAAVGAGGIRPGDRLMSIGTSGQVLCVTEGYAPDAGSLVHAFAHCLPGGWLRLAAVMNGARPLMWFAGMTGQPLPALLEEAAAAAPDRVPLFLPYLSGERMPYADPHIRGAFAGLGDGTTRGEMMRAVIEAVAYSMAEAARALPAQTGPGRGGTPLVATGGGTRARLLMQILADCLETEIAPIPAAAAGSAYGASLLAALAMGATDPAALRARPGDRMFHPDPDPAIRARHAERQQAFGALYAALAPLHRPSPAAG